MIKTVLTTLGFLAGTNFAFTHDFSGGIFTPQQIRDQGAGIARAFSTAGTAPGATPVEQNAPIASPVLHGDEGQKNSIPMGCVFHPDSKLIECPVTVDYTQTLKQTIKAGNYIWNYDRSIDKSFPESYAKNGIDKKLWHEKAVAATIILIPISAREECPYKDCSYKTETIVSMLNNKMSSMGLRHANVYELLALRDHPYLFESMYRHKIAGFGSAKYYRNYLYHYGSIPYIEKFSAADRGYLRFQGRFDTWYGNWLFATVRKQPAVPGEAR
ncbi:MAG: hypothetical protein HY401_06325 [Elusimicrobia bacterium]|nr:hypothetical protein [Elusimicrobiota bacterium]